MAFAFRDRPPSEDELERLRLVLSVFQDGSGNVRVRDGTTRAEWRQVALTCHGGVGIQQQREQSVEVHSVQMP
jgi:hypothetical protein